VSIISKTNGLKAVYVFLAGLAAGTAFAQDVREASEGVSVGVQGSFNFGPIDGYFQTPTGGRPGTSSTRRPKFDELGIDDVAFYDARLNVQWRDLLVYGGYEFIRLNDSVTLSQPLITHGVPFAAGEHVSTDDQLDWGRIGAGWTFRFLNDRLKVTPKAELALLDFDYHLSGGAQSTSRSYIKGCGRLGLEGTYYLTRMMSLNLDGAASLPLSNTPQIATVAATANVRVLDSHRMKADVFAGVGMQWIDYEDNQRLSNHIKADIGPFVTAGIGFSF
jgi:hypothetical protein